jgi:hypothetical protein
MSASTNGFPASSMGLTYEECLPFLCGQSGSQAQMTACAMAGYNGNLGCDNPACSAYCPTAQPSQTPSGSTIPATPVPRVTQAQIGTTQTQPAAPAVKLSPQTLQRPLPSITSALAPAPPAPNCTAWDELNGAIEQYPIIAVGILAGLYFLLRGNNGRR